MKLITCLIVALAVTLAVSGEQQRILRRVIKSTPTASNLGRVRLVSVRSATAESGAVTEITSKEAASFGQRGINETTNSPGIKSKPSPTTSTPSSTTTTTTTTTTTPLTSTTPNSLPITTTTTLKPGTLHRASDRQQAGAQTGSAEVELLAGAPSSWQTMTAVEAPAAMLIATGTRPALNDLSSSSSNLNAEESTGDFLRSSSTKGSSHSQQTASETFSRIRQQSTKAQQQQSYFYPQQSRALGKTSNVQATKTHWYQPKPAPIVQEQYEEQKEQYVEQQRQEQQQVDYGAAPLGQAEPFAFDFKTQDNSGNGQYRKEESDKNGVVRGSYGYTDANGIYRHVEYVADQNGFRANIKSNEPGLIGETQPASIQMASGQPSANQRLSATNSLNDNGDWNSNDQSSPADLALAPPNFESSHHSERIRQARHFRNN